MNVKKLGAVVAATGALAVVGAFLLPSGGEGVAAAASFPFVQIGGGLRALSLSGTAGNAVAVALWVALSLLPLLGLGALALKKRPLHWEDGLLGLLSPILLYVLWYMVNPGALAARFGGSAMGTVATACAGGVVWSVVAAWVILKLLRAFGGGQEKLLGWMDGLLAVLCVILTWAAVWALVRGSVTEMTALAEANTAVPQLSNLFAVLGSAVDALPQALEVWVLLAAFPLTAALAADPFGESVAPAALRLAGRCKVSVAAVVLAQAGFNLVQLLLAEGVRSSSYLVRLPLFDLGVVLAVLLAAHYLACSRALKEENDSFV